MVEPRLESRVSGSKVLAEFSDILLEGFRVGPLMSSLEAQLLSQPHLSIFIEWGLTLRYTFQTWDLTTLTTRLSPKLAENVCYVFVL